MTLLSSLINIHASTELATFSGGCFWCMEPPFEKINGVQEVISGYAGGKEKNPTYEEVSSGKTGHRESVQITFDSKIVSYKRLLEVFWTNINPTDAKGQFNDRGFQYTTAIFFHNEEQKILAEESKKQLENSKRFKSHISTPILPYSTFYPAEDYHQNYYRKNLLTKTKYKYYRNASGRDDFIDKNWTQSPFKIQAKEVFKKPLLDEIKKNLTSLQFDVTQNNGTEPPFKNTYWNNKKEGIYVDIVSGEPLFSSKDKFDSGTGWPSFTRPLSSENIIEREDNTLFTTRTEVRSRRADSHLGHVFNDGPEPTKLRYCINSASLRFVPKEDLKKEGLEEFIKEFSR